MRITAAAAALMVAGCSTGLFYDPVFLAVGEVQTTTGACPEGSTCVEVEIEGVRSAAGQSGTCAIYAEPGDAASMQPLVEEDLSVPDVQHGDDVIPLRWEVEIPGDVDVAQAWALCDPMVEG